jgi:hypothetical protein
MSITGEQVFEYLREVKYVFSYPKNEEEIDDTEKYTPKEFMEEIDACILDNLSGSSLDDVVDYYPISARDGILTVMLSLNSAIHRVRPVNDLSSYRHELERLRNALANPLYDDTCLVEYCPGRRGSSGFCDTHKGLYKKEDFVEVHRNSLRKRLADLMGIKVLKEFTLEILIPRGDEYPIKFTMIEPVKKITIVRPIIAAPGFNPRNIRFPITIHKQSEL